MNKTLSVTIKLAVFIVFALIFAVALIALSARHEPLNGMSTPNWSNFSEDGLKKIEKKFTVKPGDQLLVAADAGNISITGTDIEELSVVVTARGSEKYLDSYNVSFDQSGSTVKIEGKMDKKYFHFFDGWSLDVQYEIRVPKNFNLDMQTSGGNISVENVKGTITGSTSGGNVDIASLDGMVKLSTSGGNVSITDSKGNLDLRTSGGNIKGVSVDGTIDVETSGGNITFRETKGKLYASTSGGDIRVDLKENNGVSLHTSGGSIAVRIPKSLAANIDAETTGGDVNCELEFSGKIKDGKMNGKINGGGNLMQLETSGGDIEIASLE